MANRHSKADCNGEKFSFVLVSLGEDCEFLECLPT